MKNTIKYILPIIFLLFSSSSLLAQYTYTYDQRCKDAYKAVLSLRLDEAERLIVVEKQLHPDNNIPYLIESYMLFFKVFIGEDEVLFKRYDKRKDAIYERLDQGDDGSPYYLYSKAVVNAHWALARMKFSEFLTAAFEFRKSYIQLEENKKKFPNFLPDNLYTGIFHIAVGSVPSEYMWLVNLLGFEGTIKQGQEEIQYLIDDMERNSSLSFYREEVVFYKTFLDINITNELESAYLQYQNNKAKMDTNLLKNPLMTYALSRLLKEKKFNDEAIDLLENRYQGKEYYPFYYLDYLTGYYKLQRLDETANKDILKFINNFCGKIYLKSAYQKLSWYYLINGDIPSYKKAKQRILKVGNLLSDDDKQAEAYAKEQKNPNIYLLKARLLSDGGYFERAQKSLTEGKKDILSSKDSRDQIEYYYRLARVYHEWGKEQESIPYYKQSIEKGKNLPYYYAANSALKLGNIYEKNKDYKKALKYYKWAMNMKNEEYKSSIALKAKAGVQRISEIDN